MKQYKLLKDLPGIPAGSIGYQKVGDTVVFVDTKYPLTSNQFPINYIKEYPDFYEEVKEEEKLFGLKDMENAYLRAYEECSGFYGKGLMADWIFCYRRFMKRNYPHINIDQ